MISKNEIRNTKYEIEESASTLNAQCSTLTTRCGFCAYEFSEEEGEKTCGKCAHFGGCKMVMCPRCNYEMPQTPRLIKMLKQWRIRRNEAAR